MGRERRRIIQNAIRLHMEVSVMEAPASRNALPVYIMHALVSDLVTYLAMVMFVTFSLALFPNAAWKEAVTTNISSTPSPNARNGST